MNFLIDGAYGDLYRAAMLCPQRHKSDDAWDMERRMVENTVTPRLAPARLGLAARLIAMITHRKVRAAGHAASEALPTA